MKSFDQQVADWARTKPADEYYEYRAPCGCAIAQFLMESGMAVVPMVGAFDWFESGNSGAAHPIPENLAHAVQGHPRTFGALADRLSHA